MWGRNMDEQKIVSCIETIGNAEGSCVAFSALFEHLTVLLEGHVQISTEKILRGVSSLLLSVASDLAATNNALMKLIDE